jgi:hypothetical protein
MSFGIRQTFKPRPNPNNKDFGVPQDLPNHEATQEIINAIQKFKAKSAHENLLSPGERQNILRKSSVNPEINPAAQRAVEQMLRPGEEYRDPSTLSTNEMVGPHDGIGTVGFSSLSTTGYHQGMQKAKLEKELAKELEEIKERHRRKRTPEETEEEETEDDSKAETQDSKYDESGMNLVDQTPIMQIALDTPNYTRRPVSTLKPIFEEFQQQPAQPAVLPTQKPKKTKKKAADTTAKRMVMMGYPARASMARGVLPRQGGSSGMSVKRTAIGMVDAF